MALSAPATGSYGPSMGVAPAVRELACPIAEKPVRAVLRRGGMLGGPPTMHVRCSEISCQYIDSNEPPCPLNVQLFASPSDRLIADRLTAQAEPMCLECVTQGLQVTYAEVRRGLWPLADQKVVRVRSGRCRKCGRRRLVVHAARPRRTRGAPPPTITTSPVEPPTTVLRILRGLAAGQGHAYCPACLALAAGTSLLDVRQALAPSGPLFQFEVGPGECDACGRHQPVRGAFAYAGTSYNGRHAGRDLEHFGRQEGLP